MFVGDKTNSLTWCLEQLTYSLATGENCDSPASTSDFEINASNTLIELKAQNSFEMKVLCLVAETKGKVKAIQQFTIQVCGSESVSLQVKENFKAYHTFDRLNPSQTIEILSFEDLGINFQISGLNCTALQYRLIENNTLLSVPVIEREFNGHELTIDSLERQLRLDKSNPFEFRGYIQAFFQGNSVSADSPMINIIVCGYESRTSTRWRDQIFRPLVISQKEPLDEPNYVKTTFNFTDRFINNLNNSNCSLASFKLLNQNNSELSFQQSQDFQLIQPQGHDTQYFVINQNFDLNYEQKFYEIEVLKYRVEFWIFAYTAGNKMIPYYLILEFEMQSSLFTDYGFSFFATACKTKCNPEDEVLLWRKIYYLKPFVIEGAREDYKTMLEEVYFNSMVFDQPNNDPWDENTIVCRIKIEVIHELVKANALKYATANPSNPLPYEKIQEAFRTSVDLEIQGETSKAIYCKTNTGTLQDIIDGDGLESGKEFIDQIMDASQQVMDSAEVQALTKGKTGQNEAFKQQGSQKVKEFNQTTQIRQMRISNIKMFYDLYENIFLDVNFDMDVKQLDEEKINQLNQALILRLESARDGSSMEGIWVPKYQDANRQLCANETCEAEKYLREFKESKYFVSWSFQKLQFKWEYWSMGSRNLRFKIDFQYPYNVSTSSGAGQDQMKLKVRGNYILLGEQNGLQMNKTQFGNDVEFSCYLKPKKSTIKVEQQIAQSVRVVSAFGTVLYLSAVAARILNDKLRQDAWGVINSQIIVIHMILFKCQMTTPPNIYTFNSKLSDFTQRDQYPTDIIYKSIFNFKDKNSPVEHFEFLGYEGVIFINLSGSILINIILPIIFWIIQLLFIRLARCCQNVTVIRRISVYLGKTNIFSAIAAVYLAGFLELTMSALISIEGQENAGYKRDFSSNSISAIFMMISIMVMLIIIIQNIYVAIVYRGELRSPEVQEKYGFIYEGFKTDKFLTSIFQVIFMVRRILFALIIVFMTEFNGVQLVLSTNLILFYVVYLCQLQPYEDLAQNNAEIFNDVCTLLVSYFLMWLSIFPDYTEEELPMIETIGWFYITTASFNIVKNISSLIYGFIIRIPRNVKRIKRKIFDFKYERWKKQFVKQMKHRSKFDPNAKLAKYFGNEACKIELMEAYEKQLEIIKARHAKEYQWVIDNNFEDPRYETYIKNSQETELANFNKKYQTLFNPEIENEFLIKVKLDLNDMTPFLMPHNHPNLLNSKCFYPYREQRYIEIHQLAMVGGKELGLEEARQVNRKVFIAKQKHLLDFLQFQEYLFVPMTRDGNSGPRAIAAFAFRDQTKWPQVRQKVCKKLEKQLRQKLKNNDEAVKENFDSRLERILRKKESGQIFSRIELQACSNIYKLTIVVFSIFNKSRFMDYLIVPEGKPDHKSVPLYLLDHGNYFTILVHRAQQNLQRFMTSQGLELKQFKKSHFLLEDNELVESFKSDQVRSPIEDQKVNPTSRKEESKADDQEQKMKSKHKKRRRLGSSRKQQTKAYEKLREKQKSKQLLTDIEVIDEQEEEQTPREDKNAPKKKKQKTKKAQIMSDEEKQVIVEKVKLSKKDKDMIEEAKIKTLERQEDREAQIAKRDQDSDQVHKSKVLDLDQTLYYGDLKCQPAIQNDQAQGDESLEETIPWEILEKMRSKNQVKRVIRF